VLDFSNQAPNFLLSGFFVEKIIKITFPKQFFTKKEQKSEKTILLP